MAVLKQQIQEPLEEIRLRQFIPSLTTVDDQISVAVQDQYEKNPYPRWVSLPRAFNSKLFNSYIAKKYPLSTYNPQADDRNLEVLIAGCGTGQHPIACAQLIMGAKILAVDLSISSLAYAKRKTLEMGIGSIDYAQADLLKLASIGKEFDIIESVGVLHHMDKPFDGWEALVSILRPNGIMRLGFYSELARQDIVRVRGLISRHNAESSSQGIRNYRHYFLESQDAQELKYATDGIDFYSMSACRDLIFHVQEHRMQLDSIAQFLGKHQLEFLGFDIDRSIINSYKACFPDDPSASNLENWHVYEQKNPHTFTSMYQFLVQKKSLS
jgi:2-polyprenyl-3-methyl-5-hydroxy-6-metoxy-1,4-benzoquinol methylase